MFSTRLSARQSAFEQQRAGHLHSSGTNGLLPSIIVQSSQRQCAVLRKFISIKNVGRFVNCNAAGDVELKRYTLIFAENGRGKTTLCAILRSLQSGEAAHIIGRTTLAGTDPPQIEILTDAGV